MPPYPSRRAPSRKDGDKDEPSAWLTPLMGRSRNREEKAEARTTLTCGGRFLRLYPAPMPERVLRF